MKAKIKRNFRHGTRLVTNLVEFTGLPQGYATTVAWFAERMILATLCLVVLSFGAGVIFAVRLSEPIVASKFFNETIIQTKYAQRQVIDVFSPVFSSLIKANHDDADIAADTKAERKEKLRAYYTSKGSPFAKDDGALDAFAESKNMKMMVAITFVESTHGKNCYYNNCSGITGSKGLRKYKTRADWVRDFDSILEKRYKNLPPEDYLGLYVQPGSPNWLYGVNQVLDEFEQQGIS